MNIKTLIGLASIGIFAGLVSVWIYNEKVQSQPPIAVSYNPYETGVYATGIIESNQPDGSNVNIFPEVSGKVSRILAKDGDVLKKGTPILIIESNVQSRIVEKDQAEVALSSASLLNAEEQYAKIKRSYQINPKSISKNTLDNALNSVKIAIQNVNVAKAQLQSDQAVLDKYIIRAPIDGNIFRIVAAVGGYVSPQGSYDPYTQTLQPIIQMGVVTPYLQVRCFLDEILVPRLPTSSKLEATLFIRGENNKSIPLEFVNIQPYTVPKIQLSDQRQERVDVRVLPIIFKLKKPADTNIYPGQLVDIYLKGKA